MNFEDLSRSSHDNASFLEKVMIDVRSFVYFLDNRVEKKEVLLFPPINNFRRFLIHQVVEQVFSGANLKTLSIGKLDARRTIVYHNSIRGSIAPSDQGISPSIRTSQLRSSTMSRVSETRTKKSRKPDIQIYVPRGRRMLQTSPRSSDDRNRLSEEVKTCSKNYSETDSSTTENWDVQTEETDYDVHSSNRSANDSINSTASTIENCNPSCPEHDLDLSKTENHDSETNAGDIDSFGELNSKIEDLVLNPPSSKLSSQDNSEMRVDSQYTQCLTHPCDTQTQKSGVVDLTGDEKLLIDLTSDDRNILSIKNTNDTDTIIGSNCESELPEQNKNTTLSSESIENKKDSVTKSESKPNHDAISSSSSSIEIASSKSKSNSPKTKNEPMKASECDWEELFDDSGDFVDETLIDELLKTVGKVHIQHTEQDYTPFQTTEERTSNGESIIEVHSFPADFKTDDLITVFAQYRRADQNFQIVWVDDTHALAIFSSPILADEVLNQELPFVKTRPLKNAIPKSRMKARDFVSSPATRPKTCVSLARRLVSSHLGMRISITDKQREAEKKLLSDAREKKRRIAKQKNDVWNDVSSDGK